jgi:hypothetical protein
MPGDRNLLRLDLSLAIPTRVLRFEDSGLRRRTLVRPTGQTVLALLQHRLWFFGLGFVDQRRNPCGFLVNHWKPRELGVASANRHS